MPHFVIMLLLALFSCVPFLTTAQTTTELQINPQFPKAGETATASFPVNMGGIIGGEIKWFINGVEKTSFKNNRSISFTVNRDETTQLRAEVTSHNGEETLYEKTISPVRVDILVNTDTLVPNFYKGRPLPVSGSQITATALVFENTIKSTGEYLYLWEVDNKQQNNDPTRTSNTITFSPKYESQKRVSVTVLDSSGRAIAKESVLIPIAHSELHFYEVNPLKGQSPIALKENDFFVGEEMTVKAQPYYINASPENMTTQWKVDGKKVTASSNPLELNIRKLTEIGSVYLSFSLFNKKGFI